MNNTAAHPWNCISFTTDYGLEDGFVAACAGVIATIAPAARVIDITHAVPAQDIRRGAVVLEQTAPYLPPAVHLAVVDPGVGTQRRGVLLVAGDATAVRGLLVGPDNGLLLPAAEALGGLRAAYELAEPRYWLPEVSMTFHGRDVFAPVAAHLATGVPPESFGPSVPLAELVRLPEPVNRVERGAAGPALVTEVIAVDRFGNVQLAAHRADLARLDLPPGQPVGLHSADASAPGEARTVLVGRTFADVAPGELVLIVDSSDRLAVAVNGGAAAVLLGVQPGSLVRLDR